MHIAVHEHEMHETSHRHLAQAVRDGDDDDDDAKSTKPHRIAEDFDVFDFALSDDERAAIEGLDTRVRGGPVPNAITWRASAERSPKRDRRQRSSVGSWPSRPGAHPLGVATHLAIAAASGLLTLQTLAAAFHLSRGETSDLWLNAVLAGLAAVAVWAATAL